MIRHQLLSIYEGSQWSNDGDDSSKRPRSLAFFRWHGHCLPTYHNRLLHVRHALTVTISVAKSAGCFQRRLFVCVSSVWRTMLIITRVIHVCIALCGLQCCAGRCTCMKCAQCLLAFQVFSLWLLLTCLRTDINFCTGTEVTPTPCTRTQRFSICLHIRPCSVLVSRPLVILSPQKLVSMPGYTAGDRVYDFSCNEPVHIN